MREIAGICYHSTNEEEFCDQKALEIRSAVRRGINEAYSIGTALKDVKEVLDHGSWLPWLEHHFGWSHGTASNYMNLATAISRDRRILELTSLTLAYEFPQLPKRTQETIIENKAFTPRDAQPIIDQHRREDWTTSMEEYLANGPPKDRSVRYGDVMAWTEDAMDDEVLRPAAVALAEKHKEILGRLSDMAPAEVRADMGVTRADTASAALSPPNGVTLVEAERYWLCEWDPTTEQWNPIAPVSSYLAVWPGGHTIAAFPQTNDGPMTVAWQNNVIGAVCRMTSARTVEDLAREARETF